jgi:CxxC-x17-CxxC domain-containing protein
MEIPQLPINKDLTYLGLTSFRDKNQLFGIKRKDRRQHVYLLGKSGTGKSVLMFNMIIQNIQNGDGVCMVDPHGENVEAVLSAIPPHRMKDVVYFNPADPEHHIGFNILELVDPQYKHLVASGLMGIFTKIWANAWSARMEYILNNAILALLDTPDTTILGIQRMLVDKDYRQKIISNLKDPVIKAFWIHEYETWQEKFRNEAIAPIQNKVGQFLSTSIIRNVVGQAKSTIDIFRIMNEGKIFLVNVSKGRIGEDNSSLLGGMIITKLQLAAMERVRIPEDERKDFYLYVDEFQNFVTESFASILSEARKYRLNLTVAHQYTAQLISDKSSSVRDAVFGNVGTMIVFRVGADDAEFLEKEFEPEFTPQDLVNLPNYKIYLKLMIDGITSRPFSAKTLPPMAKSGNKEVEAEVVKTSRTLYCRPKAVVEREINDWSGMALGNESEGGAEKFPTVCSICHKDAFVPFKPEPGRSVYCKDCIAKVKSGELKQIKG